MRCFFIKIGIALNGIMTMKDQVCSLITRIARSIFRNVLVGRSSIEFCTSSEKTWGQQLKSTIGQNVSNDKFSLTIGLYYSFEAFEYDIMCFVLNMFDCLEL